MIKILIVDDSETETLILKKIFAESDDLKVIACAKNGAEALKLIPVLKPDLITMDVNMPVMDGIEATQRIMAQYPTPIVMISSALQDESLNATFRALDAGALTVLDKPVNITSPTFVRQKKRIIDTIRSMAEIKVIKRLYPQQTNSSFLAHDEQHVERKIIAIGASTGGTQALKIILSQLPEDFPVPIVIVQHMIPGFINGFTQWLNDNIALRVQCISDAEVLQKGRVYFAADQVHFEIQRKHNQLISTLRNSSLVYGFCPSINVLFASVAKACNQHAVGILLSGMGSDGAEGLLALKQAKAHTIIQDQESSVVFGMASVAQSLGAVDRVVNLDQIAAYLMQITCNTR